MCMPGPRVGSNRQQATGVSAWPVLRLTEHVQVAAVLLAVARAGGRVIAEAGMARVQAAAGDVDVVVALVGDPGRLCARCGPCELLFQRADLGQR